jgi:hypothetical protein
MLIANSADVVATLLLMRNVSNMVSPSLEKCVQVTAAHGTMTTLRKHRKSLGFT